MKRLLLSLVAVLSLFGVCRAQYVPTTSWPYVYEDFQDGTVLLQGGKQQSGKYNINLADNKLHYIDGAFVKAAEMKDILSLKIGADVYHNANGELLKVLEKSEKSLVVEASEIDYAALNETGGAYGSSSTTIGTTALSSLEGIGATNASSNINHMELRRNKESGKSLTLINKKYMLVNGYKIFAGKKDFMDAPGLDKEAAKQFLKENKIKWSKPQDILKAGDFLADYVK